MNRLTGVREVIRSLSVILSGIATPESLTETGELRAIGDRASKALDRAIEELLDRILDYVEVGVISPTSARSYAWTLGDFEVFRVFTPFDQIIGPPSSNDPTWWSLGMSVSWIATRSIESVRAVSAEVRIRSSGWRMKAMTSSEEQSGEVGFVHGKLGPLPIKRLGPDPRQSMSVHDATAALWSALANGRVGARSAGAAIPSDYWETCVEGESADTLVRAGRPGIVLFEAVRVDAAALRRAFPLYVGDPVDLEPDRAAAPDASNMPPYPDTELMRTIRRAVLTIGKDQLERHRLKKKRRELIGVQMRLDGFKDPLPSAKSFQRFDKLFRWDSGA